MGLIAMGVEEMVFRTSGVFDLLSGEHESSGEYMKRASWMLVSKDVDSQNV